MVLLEISNQQDAIINRHLTQDRGLKDAAISPFPRRSINLRVPYGMLEYDVTSPDHIKRILVGCDMCLEIGCRSHNGFQFAPPQCSEICAAKMVLNLPSHNGIKFAQPQWS